jgi:DNA-binding PadR family transcriptional regulator
MPRGWIKPTSLMVRDLLAERPKSPYEVWKEIQARLEGTAYLKPSYTNIKTLFYILRRLGLIRLVGVEKASRKGYFDKKLYTVVKRRLRALEWNNPTEALYRPEAFNRRVHF